ncbi:ArsR/SmtB family transcription factor [Paenibacillus sp. NPDC057934]|uniref:ArsR/SmtB family transcription factor n=1 Tax=Paenibacillus sp. NPDC057934 TaxID=3346282 RepID=UPI0036D8331F
MSSVLYAMSDPIRLYLVNVIHRTGERSCGDIAVLVLKFTLSHHIRTLREYGVVLSLYKAHNASAPSVPKISTSGSPSFQDGSLYEIRRGRAVASHY